MMVTICHDILTIFHDIVTICHDIVTIRHDKVTLCQDMMPYLVTGKRDVIGDITQSPRVAGDVAKIL